MARPATEWDGDAHRYQQWRIVVNPTVVSNHAAFVRSSSSTAIVAPLRGSGWGVIVLSAPLHDVAGSAQYMNEPSGDRR